MMEHVQAVLLVHAQKIVTQIIIMIQALIVLNLIIKINFSKLVNYAQQQCQIVWLAHRILNVLLVEMTCIWNLIKQGTNYFAI